MIIIYFLVKVFSYMYVTICWCIFQALFLLKSYTCNYSKMPFSRKLLTHCHFSIEFGYVCVAENSPDWAHCHLMILPTGTVFVVKMLPLSVSQSQLVCCKRSSNFLFFLSFSCGSLFYWHSKHIDFVGIKSKHDCEHHHLIYIWTLDI